MEQPLSNFTMLGDHPEGILKHTLLGPTPRVSVSVGLGWDQEICVSNKFLGCGTILSEPRLWKHL